MKRRKYKSGTRWCVWRWTDVDSEYITRLHLLKTPWFALCLHWINKGDPEPYLHDHPVSFLSVILRGGYSEHRVKRQQISYRTHRWFNWVKADQGDRHTIATVLPGTLTICFMGPKVREWGFTGTDLPGGWMMWKDYYAKQRLERRQGEEALREDRGGLDSLRCGDPAQAGCVPDQGSSGTGSLGTST